MEFIKLIYNNRSYCYKDASSIPMNILGRFLYSDIGCGESEFFKRWALADKEDPASKFTYHIGANATLLEEEDDGYIYLYDTTERFSEKTWQQYLKISRHQFVQLLDDWQEKVCKLKPKEVAIKHENDQFTIETKN